MEKINTKTLEKLKSMNRKEMEDAFNRIYQEYAYLVYYVSLKIVRQSSIAEEITNEVFYQFFVNKNEIQADKNLKYYLVTISKNLSFNYLSSQKDVVELNEELLLNTQNNDQDHFDDYIQQFKDFLNEEEVDILVLHFLYGFTFKEIASEKKVSTDSISSKYRRTMQKVKKHYKGD